MKDFVRDAWKIAAGFASGAFALSLVIGLIASNPFGIAISRAFLLALLFAAFGAGLRFLVKAYLPELLATAEGAADTAATASAAAPAKVDIVLPDDEGLRRQAYQGPQRAAAAEDAGDSGEEEPAEELEEADDESSSRAEARALGDFAQELAEELPPSEGAAHVESAKDAEAAAEEVEPEEELPRGVAEPVGDLDSLPDIAALEDLGGPRQGAPTSARATRASSRDTPEDAVRNMLSNEDPATLARAIRTALKKEEKG